MQCLPDLGTTLAHDTERETAFSRRRNRNPTIGKDAESSGAGCSTAWMAGIRPDTEVGTESRAKENGLSTEASHHLKPQAARVRDSGSQGRDTFAREHVASVDRLPSRTGMTPVLSHF